MAAACRSTGGASLVMVVPEKPYISGRTDPTWSGRVVVNGDRMEIEFPAIAANNIGCGHVDTLGTTPRRRYYWLASASYPGSRYPNNHFQQVALDVSLPPAALPTKGRLDNLLDNDSVVVRELAGEPPMIASSVRPDSADVILVPTVLKGERAWRLQIAIRGAAVNAFLAAEDDTIALSWCQRDQWLTSIRVPVQRAERGSLKSFDAKLRVEAFYRLSKSGMSTALAADLLTPLETENALIYAINRTGTSVSDSLGEGWGEYYAEVRGACRRNWDPANPDVYAALADAAYNEDSPHMRELARDHGETMLSRLLERSAGDEPLARIQAVKMLGLVSEFSAQFTGSQKGAIRRAFLRAVGDESFRIREAGIHGLGEVGVSEDIPLLQRIAATDQHRVSTRAGESDYPLRKRLNAPSIG
jgi:hypothetical protein